MLPLLDHALAYLSHGYSVIPCNEDEEAVREVEALPDAPAHRGRGVRVVAPMANAAIGVVTGKVPPGGPRCRRGQARRQCLALHQCAPRSASSDRWVTTSGCATPRAPTSYPRLPASWRRSWGWDSMCAAMAATSLRRRRSTPRACSTPGCRRARPRHFRPPSWSLSWSSTGTTAVRHRPVDQDDTQTLSDDEQWLTRALGVSPREAGTRRSLAWQAILPVRTPSMSRSASSRSGMTQRAAPARRGRGRLPARFAASTSVRPRRRLPPTMLPAAPRFHAHRPR